MMQDEFITETGERIASHGVDVLIGVRGLASEMVNGARYGGPRCRGICSRR